MATPKRAERAQSHAWTPATLELAEHLRQHAVGLERQLAALARFADHEMLVRHVDRTGRGDLSAWYGRLAGAMSSLREALEDECKLLATPMVDQDAADALDARLNGSHGTLLVHERELRQFELALLIGYVQNIAIPDRPSALQVLVEIRDSYGAREDQRRRLGNALHGLVQAVNSAFVSNLTTVRHASGSPEEGSPDRAPIPVPEAAVTEADAPRGLSDKAPPNTTAPAAAPTVVMDTKRTIHLPFDEQLFARLAADHSPKVTAQAKRLLIASDEIHKDPGRHLVGLTQRIGGRPPGVSPMPNIEDLEALSKLLEAYQEARREGKPAVPA